LTSELTTKRRLIRDLVPTASAARSSSIRAALNPGANKRHRAGRGRDRAAVRILNASSDRDIDAAFATLVKPRDAALW
jgi:hypothetical protein